MATNAELAVSPCVSLLVVRTPGETASDSLVLTERLRTGAPVGGAVEIDVGAWTGAAVGPCVGVAMGALVGAVNGPAVGDAEDTGVGTTEGVLVGAVVEPGLGAGVT